MSHPLRLAIEKYATHIDKEASNAGDLALAKELRRILTENPTHACPTCPPRMRCERCESEMELMCRCLLLAEIENLHGKVRELVDKFLSAREQLMGLPGSCSREEKP